MDPEATLQELREALTDWYGEGDEDRLKEAASSADILIAWLDKGGHLPRCWQRVEES